GSGALAHPSVTVITMPVYVPFTAVPDSTPLRGSKFAQNGAPAMEKVRGARSCLPVKSVAVGWKKYCEPPLAVVGGVPLMIGSCGEYGGGGGPFAEDCWNCSRVLIV